MEVLNQGGNAVDAAVAVCYALAVVHPEAGNLGGGGFAVLRMADGRSDTLDFREKAPLKAAPHLYLDKNGAVIPQASTLGYRAAAVPGTVAGMSALLDKYGSKSLAELIAPAIKLADQGYTISARQEKSLAKYAPDFARFASSRKYFLHPDGRSFREDELFVQKDLAKSLRLIAAQGQDAFYKGFIADLIVADMAANQGLISSQDILAYSAIWRAPLKGSYRGYEIFSMGPPSSGGALLIQMLNVMENADIKGLGFASSQIIHFMAEAMRQAFADRQEHLGDPDFVQIPLDKLTSKDYAEQIAARILENKNRALPAPQTAGQARESLNTTHYSIVDKWGNAIAVTCTLNDAYGSKAAIAGAGFLLNNEMDDFTALPGASDMYGITGGAANAIQAGKRPLSCMTPSIILKDSKLFMILGSPGGPRIITTVLQVISNVIDHGMSISAAICAPRFHMQGQPDELRIEPGGLVKDVRETLIGMGYAISEQAYMGEVNAILADPESGFLYSSGDPRAELN
jgi:gamma-glutamyltranspeptidase/glutathione hydrolase